MDETSEQTTGAVTREVKPERQRDVNLLLTEREAIKTAKVFAKKASLRGKMSYVTKLINNVNKQVSENGEPKQVDFNIQSLKKSMTSFRAFNDEYVELLEDSQEIDRVFMTLLGLEDNFQQCIEAAESYLAECRRESRSNRSSRKSGKYSISSSSTRSDRHKAQDPREIEIEHGASTKVKFETTANHDSKFVVEDTIFRGMSDKNMPSMMRLTPSTTLPLSLGAEHIIPLGKFSGKKELWPRFIQTFKVVLDKQPYEPIVKLAILEQHIIGQAKDCIKGFPFDEKSYPLVLKTLEDRFGDDDDHAAFHLGAIEDLPRVKEKEASSLRKFFDDLQAHIQILEAQGPDVICHLCDPRRLKVVLSKLPMDVVIAWTSYKEDKNLNNDIRLLCEWLRRRVRILEKADVKQLGETRSRLSIHATLNTSSRCDTPNSKQCWLCQGNHVIFKCQK